MPITEALRLRSEHVLEKLMESLPGLSAAVLASSDGFEVAARGCEGAEVAKLAAMACSISAIGAMAGSESGIGQYRSLTIDADEGFILIMEVANPDFPMILNLVVAHSEMLGQVLYLAKRSVGNLAQPV